MTERLVSESTASCHENSQLSDCAFTHAFAPRITRLASAWDTIRRTRQRFFKYGHLPPYRSYIYSEMHSRTFCCPNVVVSTLHGVFKSSWILSRKRPVFAFLIVCVFMPNMNQISCPRFMIQCTQMIKTHLSFLACLAVWCGQLSLGPQSPSQTSTPLYISTADRFYGNKGEEDEAGI